MSFFRNQKASLKRSVSILFAAMCCIFFLFPIYSYAETTEGSLTEQVVLSKKVYHKHTGNQDNGGGCYNVKKTKTETIEIPCKGKMIYWPALGTTSCNQCGASYFGDQSGRECWKSTTEERTYTYYELGCGMKTNTVLGTLTVSKNTNEWTKCVILTASYDIDESLIVEKKPYIWNEGEATSGNTYEVTACGEYSLRLNAKANVDSKGSKIVIDVRNIDVTPSVIREHTQEPSVGWTKEGVQVTITENVDLQPDGTEGSGPHETPYSYDNGATWTADSAHFYEENGTYCILSRDKLENSSSYTVSIQNVDRTPPVVATDYDKTRNSLLVEVRVTAQDLQPDQTQGCGLHETPYSFDNGKTWTKDNTILVDKNQSLFIAVRDQLENITYVEEKIVNIDSNGPKIMYEMTPDSWTNEEVKLYLWAEDINEDGSQGSGLSDKWYSLDDGKSWSNVPVLSINENQEIKIIARDVLGNCTKQQIVVDQIDREAPQVTLALKVSGKGEKKKAKLQVNAIDTHSGLHEQAYSWNEGISFSDESIRNVTKNGVYVITVRDKAGNVKQESIKVTVFKAQSSDLDEEPSADEESSSDEPNENDSSKPAASEPTPSESVTEETEPDISHSTETEETEIALEEEETELQTEEVEELESEETTVIMEERVDNPEPIKIQERKEKKVWTLGEVLVLILLLFVIFALITLLFLYWLWSVAVYAEDVSGQMEYMGRLWITHKEEHYEVKVPDRIVEQCETTHFQFRPSVLFVKLHADSEIHFLFPQGICATLPVAQKMEVSHL